MAIIVLTRKNFTSYLKNNIDKSGIDGMLASMMFGGKEKVKEAFDDIPEEQKIFIDTKYIMAVTPPICIKELGDVIFQITLASPVKNEQQILNIKGEEFEDFMHVWNEDREYLAPGTYKVGFGQDCKQPWAKVVSNKMWAEVSEDGLIVTVREEIPI